MAHIEIPLTQGVVALVDAADADRVLSAGKWSAYRHRNTFYAERHFRQVDGSRPTMRLHAFLTGYALTDHINGDGLDNRRANLREATTAQNNQNARLRRDNRSGFKGVYWDKSAGKWVAQIYVGGRKFYLGLHASAEDAARVRDAAAIELHGEFARLNFPIGADR